MPETDVRNGSGNNILEDVLRNESAKAKGKDDFSKETLEKDISDSVVDDANKYFLVKILAPEITSNENKKRKHKDKLIFIMEIFLIFQFSVLTVLVLGIISAIFVFHALNNDLDIIYINCIIKFVLAYITSIVVELIAMLKFIVSQVFDTSIAGLVQLYKDTATKTE